MDFGNFEVPGTTVLAAYGAFMLAIIGVILLMKNVYHRRSKSDLKTQFNAKKIPLDIASRNKYPSVDAFRLGRVFFNFGLFVAIGMAIFAFGWTQYDYKMEVPERFETLPDEIAINSPRLPPPAQPPPPPPPTKLEIAPDEEVKDTVAFIDQSIKETTPVAPVEVKKKAPAPAPPPQPIKKPAVDELFKIVEEMPSFKGCEDVSDKIARKKCAEQKLLEFIYQNIKYPAIARENSIEGTVYVRFIVNKDGSISNTEVLRGIGGGCDRETLRVVNKMPDWNPGKQRGNAVRVQFNLPVKYKLE